MENRLTVVVTGGSRGLGRKIAGYLANQGYSVFVMAKTPKNEIEPTYLSTLTDYLECDLSNTGAIEKTVAELIAKTGRIDVLINNATVREFKKT